MRLKMQSWNFLKNDNLRTVLHYPSLAWSQEEFHLTRGQFLEDPDADLLSCWRFSDIILERLSSTSKLDDTEKPGKCLKPPWIWYQPARTRQSCWDFETLYIAVTNLLDVLNFSLSTVSPTSELSSKLGCHSYTYERTYPCIFQAPCSPAPARATTLPTQTPTL